MQFLEISQIIRLEILLNILKRISYHRWKKCLLYKHDQSTEYADKTQRAFCDFSDKLLENASHEKR